MADRCGGVSTVVGDAVAAAKWSRGLVCGDDQSDADDELSEDDGGAATAGDEVDDGGEDGQSEEEWFLRDDDERGDGGEQGDDGDLNDEAVFGPDYSSIMDYDCADEEESLETKVFTSQAYILVNDVDSD